VGDPAGDLVEHARAADFLIVATASAACRGIGARRRAARAEAGTGRAPQLSLVGTITGDDQSFGIFVDRSTKAALRLKLGEDYQGWTLRSVQGREATLERDQQTAVLGLPQPGVGEAGPLRVQAENVVPTPVPADPPPRAGNRH